MMIPCIDLSEGRAVQWRRGHEPVLSVEDVDALAANFARYGEIAVIDLDAALGRGDNLDLVRRLCAVARCRVGGGIRTVERARELLDAGACSLIIGTRASPEFLDQLPRFRVFASIDENAGQLVDHGWQRPVAGGIAERIATLEPYVSGFVYTAVDREGTMLGADFERFVQVARATERPVAVAGGISSLEDVERLDDAGIDCHVGMAVYQGNIDLYDAFVVGCKHRMDSPISLVLQDVHGHMLGYMRVEPGRLPSLLAGEPFEVRKSGLMRVRNTSFLDRSRDSLRAVVEPADAATTPDVAAQRTSQAEARGRVPSIVMNRITRVCVGKGRGMEQSFDALESCGIAIPPALRAGKLLIAEVTPELTVVLARHTDIANLLRDGHVDVALASDLPFLEADDPSLQRLHRFDHGVCRLGLLRPAGADRGSTVRRVCSRHERLVRKYLPGVEYVNLTGCNEIAISLGLADAILDVLETGRTARRMGLAEVDTFAEIRHGIWARGADVLDRIPSLSTLVS